MGRDARTDDDEVPRARWNLGHPKHDIGALGPKRVRSRGQGGVVGLRALVCDRDVHVLARRGAGESPTRRSRPGHAETEDEDALACPAHLYRRKELMKNAANPAPARMPVTIQNRTMTFVSDQPFISKWWWSGAIRKMRLPVSLNDATCRMTDSPSAT